MEKLLPSSRAANAPSLEKFLNAAAPNLDRYGSAKLVNVDPGQIARRDHAQRRFVSRRGSANRWASGIRQHTGMTCPQRPPAMTVRSRYCGKNPALSDI